MKPLEPVVDATNRNSAGEAIGGDAVRWVGKAGSAKMLRIRLRRDWPDLCSDLAVVKRSLSPSLKVSMRIGRTAARTISDGPHQKIWP
jgi:hypothetical protein